MKANSSTRNFSGEKERVKQTKPEEVYVNVPQVEDRQTGQSDASVKACGAPAWAKENIAPPAGT